MRVALLSMLEAADGGEGALRAGLHVGGRIVARHQLALALALGCTRIVFIAEKLEADLVALQHVAEDAGAQFHVIAALRALIPLVSPADDLFVFSDGFLALPEGVRDLLEEGPAILTLPVETGLPAGFERLDINHSDAGTLRLPGRLVARLGDLPRDWSAQSALLRIAAQAGLPLKGVPTAMMDAGPWQLVRSETEAQAVEAAWMKIHTAATGPQSPGIRAAHLLVRAGGPAILHAGTRPWIVSALAALVAILGLGAGWFGYAGAGFAMLGVAWLGQKGAELLDRIERASILDTPRHFGFAFVFAWLLDAAFVALCAWRSELSPGADVPVGARLFAPIVLFGLLRLAPRVLPESGWTGWLADRAMVALCLVLVSVFFPFDAAVAIMALLVLAAALVSTYLLPDSPNPPLTKSR